ncbi:MAG: PKD domain-containing protein, partial [Saprospiraceae bacterium]
MKKLLLLFIIASFTQVHSQDVIIQGNSLPLNPEYSIKFNAYEMYEIDVEAIRNQISNSARSAINIDLILGTKSHLLQLNKYAVIKPECKIRIGTANGIIETSPDPSIETYRGYNANFGGGYVTLTVAKNFLSIMFKEGEETYYLEQVPSEFKNRNLNHFVLYDSKGYKITEKINCSAEEVEVLKTKQQHSIDLNTSRNQRCWEMEIALAADNAYFVTYGSSSANVQARLTNLVNLMQADWIVPVALSDYIWSISDFYIAEDLPHDPFKTASNCNDLRTLLAGAAFGGIFQGGFDIAVVWTTRFRNCQYSASQSGMCTFSPFAACSEFTQAIGVLRCLQSHTIGHTMSAVHDGGGSPTIMSANINGASSWSNQSQFDIYAWAYFIRGCLVDCSGNIIPIAEFKADPVEGCLPLVVKFTNMSTNGTSYKWSFPGGTPSISIDKDPIIVYNSAGTFNVELVVINPKCSTKLEKINYIYVKDKPKNVFFNFGAANNGNEIEFFGYADRADTYKWKFPDNTTDEGDYVTHIFPKEGSFQIELCATNDCGTTCVKQIVSNFYTPIADFTSDTMKGCAPTTIKFFDQSSTNVIAWTWSFPGGTPNGSFIKNPTVKYTRPGKYLVKLVV